MNVMSFAHLKKQKLHESETKALNGPVSSFQGQGVPTQGVMTFAHLKKGNMPPLPQKSDKGGSVKVMDFSHLKNKPQAVEIHEEKRAKCEPKLFRIPAVMPTALLRSVNYCTGCPRFWPSDGEPGNHYGRCQRPIGKDEDFETWRVIPPRAQVKRCFYMLNAKRKS